MIRKKMMYIGLTAAIFSMLLSCAPKKSEAFLSDIGVCTDFNNAGMLATHGFAYVEGGVGHVLAPLKSEEEWKVVLEQIQQSPLPIRACNSFLPGNLKVVGPEPNLPELMEYVETAFRRAQIVGVEHIVFGSGGSRGIPEGFPRDEARVQFVSFCKAIAPIAEKYGIIIVLEPLNTKEVNFINSVVEGGQIVEEVNHPNFRLLADIYHMMMEDEGPESILKYGHLIHHTHIAEKERRAAPGTHNENFVPYFEALKKVGYKGKMSVECRWENLDEQSGKAIETIKNQLLTIS